MTRPRQRGIAALAVLGIVAAVGAGIGALIHWRHGSACVVVRTGCDPGVLNMAGQLVRDNNPPPEVQRAYDGIVRACPGLTKACDNGLLTLADVVGFGGDTLTLAHWAATQNQPRGLERGVDWPKLERQARKVAK